MKLYLVTSQEYSLGPSIDIVREAARHGVDMIQMREKRKSREECIGLGLELKAICAQHGIDSIVNDDPLLAKEIDADGVHLGQEDICQHPLGDTRKLLAGKILGVSTHSLAQVESANEHDLDYIAYGPVFATQTKDYAVGTEEVEAVLKLARAPVFFIGGIKPNNIGILKQMGAENFAVITAITKAPDIAAAIAALRQA